MDDTTRQPEKELDLERRIKQLRLLRVKIKGMEDEFETLIEPYKKAKALLEGALMKWLLERKIKTANTAEGNITWVDNTTYPIEDLDAFRRHVIGSEAWELLDWKANKTAVVGYIEENKDPTDPEVVNLPPGLRENPHPHLRVSGPAKKKVPTRKFEPEVDQPEEE